MAAWAVRRLAPAHHRAAAWSSRPRLLVCECPLVGRSVRNGGQSARLASNASRSSNQPPHDRLLQELRATLQDPHASRQLASLLSPSTTKDITAALTTVAYQKGEAAATQTVTEGTDNAPVVTVSSRDLRFVALQVGLPFVGFGFVDNAIMIVAGDYIDITLGVSLGISSMAAAGIGNTISDVAGLGLGGVVESFCARLGLPTPSLTPAQMMLRQTRIAKVAGSSIGVTIGCVLGMLPLLFLETREDHTDSKKSETAVIPSV